MNKVLGILLAQRSSVSRLLPPQVQVSVVWESIMCCIQGEREGFIWQGLERFSPDSGSVRCGSSNHVALSGQALEFHQAGIIVFTGNSSLSCPE